MGEGASPDPSIVLRMILTKSAGVDKATVLNQGVMSGLGALVLVGEALGPGLARPAGEVGAELAPVDGHARPR